MSVRVAAPSARCGDARVLLRGGQLQAGRGGTSLGADPPYEGASLGQGRGATSSRGFLHEPLAAGREILEIRLNDSVSSRVSDPQMGSDGSPEAVTSFGSGPFPSACTKDPGMSSARLVLQWAPKKPLQSVVSTGLSVWGSK